MTELFTKDTLLGGQVRLRQPRTGFRASSGNLMLPGSIDSVLLAAAIPAASGDTVFEPGTGVGSVSLCLARRIEGVRVVGIELQPDLVRLSIDNARLNGLGDCFDVVVGDIVHPPLRIEPGGFSHVMMNPPHTEGESSLTIWLRSGLRLLTRRGTLTIIHRADRLIEILTLLHSNAGEIVVFPLWSTAAAGAANRVIVRARKEMRTPFRLTSGMVLHTNDGAFTDQTAAILRGAALEI